MARTILLFFMISCCTALFGQTGFIALKKKGKTVQLFFKDGHFTFQHREGYWITGIITAIKNDSFYLTQEIIHYYPMSSDTLHISGLRFSLADVSTLPTKNEELVYEGDQVMIVPGREKWVWVRNGLIFQVGGAGYVGFSTLNNLIHGEPPFARERLTGLAIGAAAFLLGTFLHHHFDPYIHLGKKYQLECMPIGAANAKLPG